MEKTVLILGSDKYGYYYGVHDKLNELGIGITNSPNVITLSDRGVSNHVYFYYRNNNLLNKYKSYSNTRFKMRELMDEISGVYVFGSLDEEHLKALVAESERKGIPVKNIYL